VKTDGTRYSPAFKFQVVLEALKAEGKGSEAQLARAMGASRDASPLEAAVPKSVLLRAGSQGQFLDGVIRGPLQWGERLAVFGRVHLGGAGVGGREADKLLQLRAPAFTTWLPIAHGVSCK